jgi:ATP-dependent Clp protease ATP-binding subunit ClpB
MSETALRDSIFALLRRHFRPELLNRIDEIVIFHALARDQIQAIADLQLAQLQMMLDSRSVRLEVTPEAKGTLADMGYDPEFGARPLKRTIQREVQNPLARMLLAGEVRAGQTVILDRGPAGGWSWKVVATAAEPAGARPDPS